MHSLAYNLIHRNFLLFSCALVLRQFPDLRARKFGHRHIDQGAMKLLRRDGVVLIPSFSDIKYCETVRAAIDDDLEKFSVVGSDHRLFGAEKEVGRVAEFNKNELLFSYAETYLRSNVCLQSTLAACLHFSMANKGSGQGWHRDSYSSQFKAMLYLHDVGDSSGPFQYLVGSHKLRSIVKELHSKPDGELMSQCRYSDTRVSEISNELGVSRKTFTAKAGDVILFDSRGIHRGAPIQVGRRYALTNYYCRASHINNRSIAG